MWPEASRQSLITRFNDADRLRNNHTNATPDPLTRAGVLEDGSDTEYNNYLGRRSSFTNEELPGQTDKSTNNTRASILPSIPVILSSSNQNEDLSTRENQDATRNLSPERVRQLEEHLEKSMLPISVYVESRPQLCPLRFPPYSDLTRLSSSNRSLIPRVRPNETSIVDMRTSAPIGPELSPEFSHSLKRPESVDDGSCHKHSGHKSHLSQRKKREY